MQNLMRRYCKEVLMPDTPNLGADLLRIHSIISRGLQISISYSRQFEKNGFPSAKIREGFFSYVQSLLSVLDAHHNLEDELAFPYLKDILPDGPYDLLMAQHQVLVPALAQAKAAVEDASANVPLEKVHDLLKKIDELWHPHIQIEEGFFTLQKLGSVIPVEEHIRLGKVYMEHSQQHTEPAFLILPFLLYNLPLDQRKVFAGHMPAEVAEQLVPVVWKEKWEPMKPFLLV